MDNYVYNEQTLGTELRAMRLRAGLSQRDVADSLGFTRQAIANYERGSRIPAINTLNILLDFYGYYLSFDQFC